MASMPTFKTLEQAVEFWETHDFEDYIEATEAVHIDVRIPRHKKSLTIPIPLKLYEQIEQLAAHRGVRLQSLVASWLKQKAKEELAAR